jgi:hypothetical protein
MRKGKWIIEYIPMIFAIIIFIITPFLQICVYKEKECCCVCMYVFVAQCHFFLSLPSLLSTVCYVHAMLASQKEREREE